jgi:hypothetical protein
MSKRHQVSRRRTYGRRQHEINELHERMNRLVAVMDWLEDRDAGEPAPIWDRRPGPHAEAMSMLAPQGLD